MANARITPGQRWAEDLSAPRRAARGAVRSLPRPSELGPRLREWTRAAVARVGHHGRTAGGVAVCAAAGEPRSYAGRSGAAGAAVTGRAPCADALPDGADGRRERARRAVASHTSGRDGLAALLDMLALHPGQDRTQERDDTAPGAAGDLPASDDG
ncbi:hypothetical protein [Streptomyces sp. NPDC058612]|uniref:hypothetical protein n=1 Tax=Streptomyces sp. NPDC058612 TaxID=3346555 RepID=UPI003648335A